jgi:trans-aconitate methyltransferase
MYYRAPVTDRDWNPGLYDRGHAFVYQLAQDLVQLLAPTHGERILDVGCGTGHLTRQIAEAGAHVVGVDQSPAMIKAAQEVAPGVEFRLADARHLDFNAEFDAVFSNAVLHWIVPPEAAAGCLFRALRPGGRLVCELGGHGNVAGLLAAIDAAARSVGLDAPAHHNYYPTIAEYAGVLEDAGFEVTSAALFDRPTPLEGPDGLLNWARMFRAPVLEAIPAARHDDFATALATHARPTLWRDQWVADYRRLRIVARRPV